MYKFSNKTDSLYRIVAICFGGHFLLGHSVGCLLSVSNKDKICCGGAGNALCVMTTVEGFSLLYVNNLKCCAVRL